MQLFPTNIRPAFTQWQISSTTINGNVVQLLQGRCGQLPVNFYFDDAGLLVRIVRWNRTAVGTVPMQFEYGDYRDVAGVKMPFRIVLTWTDGQNTIVLNEIQPNAAVNAARFARPAPFKGNSSWDRGSGIGDARRDRIMRSRSPIRIPDPRFRTRT